MAEQRGLKRELGLGSATAMVVGEVIAVGIFLTPAAMAKSLGSPLLVLVIWLVMGAMALCGAFCYGELAARFPEAGGGYIYLRQAYGPRLGFLYGWKCFLVMDPGISAALAVGIASYAGFIVPLSPFQAKVVGIAAIVGIAAVNILGVRMGAGLLRALALIKVGSLAFIVLWSFLGGLGDWSNVLPVAPRREGSAPLFSALAGGMVAGFFSFGGWWDMSKMAGEVRDARRMLPRAIALGVLAVTFVYIATSAAFMYLVPLDRVASGETFAAQAGEALFGQAAAQIFSAIVVVSVLGQPHGCNDDGASSLLRDGEGWALFQNSGGGSSPLRHARSGDHLTGCVSIGAGRDRNIPTDRSLFRLRHGHLHCLNRGCRICVEAEIG